MIAVDSPPFVGRLVFARYGDGSIAIEIRDDEPVCRATVCLDGLDPAPPPIGPHQVWIKTWAENEGLLDVLVAAGVVASAHVRFAVNAWGSYAELCNLTPAAIAELQNQGGA